MKKGNNKNNLFIQSVNRAKISRDGNLTMVQSDIHITLKLKF